ncbi:MAG: class I SAM-dependent methyltransferase [Betaproteobacteria bacterium]|nr:class I SAM-dependent methyltransferase [Betaproteobacteria bacterium]
MPHSIPEAPSEWVARFAPLIPAGGRVLDLACGHGRHARHLRELGYRVVAIDRDQEALRSLEGIDGIESRLIDIESEPWPFRPQSFDGIVVTNYLHRPLFGHLFAALREGGVLIYETFATGNEQFGRPSNPEFLLRRSELLERVMPELEVVAFEQGIVSRPKPAVVERICAIAAGAPWGSLDRR